MTGGRKRIGDGFRILHELTGIVNRRAKALKIIPTVVQSDRKTRGTDVARRAA
jgi:hypothetical protein